MSKAVTQDARSMKKRLKELIRFSKSVREMDTAKQDALLEAVEKEDTAMMQQLLKILEEESVAMAEQERIFSEKASALVDEYNGQLTAMEKKAERMMLAQKEKAERKEEQALEEQIKNL